MAIGRKPIRSADNSGNHCRFRQIECRRRFSEIALRRLLNSVQTRPEKDPVHIQLQNFFFSKSSVHLPRQCHFNDLSADRFFLHPERVPRQLHGQRARSLNHFAVFGISQTGTHRTNHVNATVLVKTLILASQQRFLKIRRHLRKRNHGPAIAMKIPNHFASNIVDSRFFRHHRNLPKIISTRESIKMQKNPE